MTKGGLDTMRSKLSSATGSNMEPCRKSIVASARVALNRANASARAETSVATTRVLWRVACSACTPQPVPRSSTCPRGRRSVMPASVVEAAPIPSTWSGASCSPVVSSVGSEATHHRCAAPTSSTSWGRRSTTARTGSSAAAPAARTNPAATAPRVAVRGKAASRSRRRTSSPSRKRRLRVAVARWLAGARRAARRAGRRCSRCRAAPATGPTSSSTSSSWNASARSARSASMSGVARGAGANRGSGGVSFGITPVTVAGRRGDPPAFADAPALRWQRSCQQRRGGRACMDLITRTDVSDLAHREGAGTCVTVFVPTQRRGHDTSGDALILKNLLDDAEKALHEAGMRRPDAEELLRPARDLQRDAMAWSHMSDGLAIFLGPDGASIFRLPIELPALATVGDRFVIAPLLRLLGGHEQYLLLTLSQDRIRLLEGNRLTVDEIELDDVPTSLGDVIAPFEPRSDALTRSLGRGQGGPAVFYGHGTIDGKLKGVQLTTFLRHVADGLSQTLKGRDLPMILAGLAPTVAAYRQVASYPHILTEHLELNPDQLSDGELHELSWPIISRLRNEAREERLGRLRALLGTGRASTNPAVIEQAATEGRIAEVLVADELDWPRTVPRVLRLGEGADENRFEFIDRAARATLATQGDVTVVADAGLPDGVAAIMRY